MKKFALIFVIIIATALRFYQLGQNPPALYWDEVALGYNAYSIAETGKDEEGIVMPYQYFRSFGDFKPPVYIYAAVPMIKMLGLSEWTTRFPSAFFGSLTVILTYLLTKKLLTRISKREHTQKENNFLSSKRIDWIALTAALLLAISPWHTQISRVAYEANIALFLVILGIYTFFLALDSTKQKNKYIFFSLSAMSFVLTLYTFNSNRVFTPLLIASMALIFSKELLTKKLNNTKPILVALIIGIVALLPIVSHLTSPEAQLRYREVNIFSDPQPVITANERIERLGDTWWANVINNRRVIYAQHWLDGYFSHFTGKFLFISGDVNPRFSTQDVGGLYIIELPFLLIGLYVFAYKWRRETAFVLVWMLLAPIPSAFAREVPHALRTLNILPTFQIITALGFIYLLYWVSNLKSNTKNISIAIASISAVALCLNSYYYLHNYYVHYPKHAQSEWQYGYKPMIEKLEELQDQYDRIIITDGLGRPYINALFYMQYPPAQFQKERQASTDQTGFGFITVDKFNKYEFKGIDWKKEIASSSAEERVLVVGNEKELKENKFTKAVIRDLNGQIVFIMNELPKGYDALRELGFIVEE